MDVTNVISEYLLHRPVSALIQGLIMGLLWPLTIASLLGNRFGYGWAIALAPLWAILMLFTVPLSIAYCLVMVMAKGPLWKYPPHQRQMPHVP